MECKELFIFENGQPLTTPPPQVSFWAFRLTVAYLYKIEFQPALTRPNGCKVVIDSRCGYPVVERD